MAHILVVDDDPQVRLLMVDILTSAGHDVFQAGSGGEGWAMCLRHGFDLVVSDVFMAGGNGIALLRQLRECGLDVPVILVSGSHGSVYDAIGGGSRIGAAGVLAKPINPGRMRAMVDSLLQESFGRAL